MGQPEQHVVEEIAGNAEVAEQIEENKEEEEEKEFIV